MGGTIRLCVVLLLIIVCVKGRVAAMQTMAEVADVAAASDIILHGRVADTAARWVHDARGRHIYTYATVYAHSYAKGSGPAETVVELQGGTVGDITEWVSDSVTVTPGEEVVLFLSRRGTAVRPAAGIHSKYVVENGRVRGATATDRLPDFLAALRSTATRPADPTRRGSSPANSQNTAPGAVRPGTKVRPTTAAPQPVLQSPTVARSAITVHTGTLPASAPTILSIQPATASAGTDTPVTITGASFGSVPGYVDFFYRSGYPTMPATILSWSDTQIVCTVPVGTIYGYLGSAGSGPLTVDNAAGTSYAHDFAVTFGYGQRKWSTTTVPYRVNPDCASCGTALDGILAAAGTWSNAGSPFRLEYAGTTTATITSYNGSNEIIWGEPPSPGNIGYANWWTSGSTMLEADITLNNWNYAWSTTGAAGCMDVHSVALHEFGHWLSLRDLYGNLGDGVNDTAKVMYGWGAAGALKRDLHPTDRAGILWIYGPDSSTAALTFTAAVSDAGAMAPLGPSNCATVAYVTPDGAVAAVQVHDSHGVTVPARPGTSYRFSPTSSASTATHRWYCSQALSGTVPAGGSQTVSRTYFEQYKPAISLTGTTSACSVSTLAHTLHGASHPDSGLLTTWTDWCDAGSTLTFSQLTTGSTLPKSTSSPRTWTVNSAFSATIGYWPQGDITHDNKVNVFDLQRLALSWNKSLGQTGYDLACDLTGDNEVNVFDLQIMAQNWNKW